MKNKKVKRRRKNKNKNKKIIISVLVILVFVFIIFTIFKGNKNPLIGTWTTERGTVYQFNKDNTGKLILSLGEYDYKYEIKDDKVFVDFISDTSIDTEFIFSFNENNLILQNHNGTFTFSKIDNKN